MHLTQTSQMETVLLARLLHVSTKRSVDLPTLRPTILELMVDGNLYYCASNTVIPHVLSRQGLSIWAEATNGGCPSLRFGEAREVR